MQVQLTRQPAVLRSVLAAGQTVSAAFQPRGEFGALYLVTPATFEGTTLTFRVSADGVSFVSLRGADGSEFTLTPVAASQAFPLFDVAPFYAFQVVSNVAAAADRELILVAQG